MPPPSPRRSDTARLGRTALTVALALEVVAGLGFLFLSWIVNDTTRFDGVLAGVFVPAAVVVALSSAASQWSDSAPLRAAQWAGFAGVVAVNLAVAARFARGVARDLAELPRLGLDVEETVASLLYCAIALAVAAGSLGLARHINDRSASARLGTLRPVLTTLLAAGALAACVSLGAAVIAAGGATTRLDCRVFRFEVSEWRAEGADSGDELRVGLTARERIAAALIRCRTLHGMTRAEVRRRLGRPDGGGLRYRRWHYSLGTVGNAIGPGESQTLSVTFSGRSNRVRRVFTLYPED